MKDIEVLNRVYGSMCIQCNRIENNLKLDGYVARKDFYNNHFNRDENGNWIEDQYPIPVITVENLCDIGVDIDFIFIDTKMKRETALKYNFNELLKYKFEVYGVEEYLNDFYNDSLDVNDIVNRIRKSDEKEIGIYFEVKYDSINEVMNIIKELNKLEVYI